MLRRTSLILLFTVLAAAAAGLWARERLRSAAAHLPGRIESDSGQEVVWETLSWKLLPPSIAFEGVQGRARIGVETVEFSAPRVTVTPGLLSLLIRGASRSGSWTARVPHAHLILLEETLRPATAPLAALLPPSRDPEGGGPRSGAEPSVGTEPQDPARRPAPSRPRNTTSPQRPARADQGAIGIRIDRLQIGRGRGYPPAERLELHGLRLRLDRSSGGDRLEGAWQLAGTPDRWMLDVSWKGHVGVAAPDTAALVGPLLDTRALRFLGWPPFLTRSGFQVREIRGNGRLGIWTWEGDFLGPILFREGERGLHAKGHARWSVGGLLLDPLSAQAPGFRGDGTIFWTQDPSRVWGSLQGTSAGLGPLLDLAGWGDGPTPAIDADSLRILVSVGEPGRGDAVSEREPENRLVTAEPHVEVGLSLPVGGRMTARLRFRNIDPSALTRASGPSASAGAMRLLGSATGTGELVLADGERGWVAREWTVDLRVERGSLEGTGLAPFLQIMEPGARDLSFDRLDASLSGRADGRWLVRSLDVKGPSGEVRGSVLGDRGGYEAFLDVVPGGSAARTLERLGMGLPRVYARVLDRGDGPRIDLLTGEAWRGRRDEMVRSGFSEGSARRPR